MVVKCASCKKQFNTDIVKVKFVKGIKVCNCFYCGVKLHVIHWVKQNAKA